MDGLNARCAHGASEGRNLRAGDVASCALINLIEGRAELGGTSRAFGQSTSKQREVTSTLQTDQPPRR